jgi:hypothetical protein
MRDLLRRSYLSRLLQVLVEDLPGAVGEDFLAKDLHFRGRKRKKRMKKPAVPKKDSVATVKAAPKKVIIFVDECPWWKGMRNVSTWPYRRILRDLTQLAKSRRDLKNRVEFRVIDGYRTSKQAAPLHCFLGQVTRKQDHREVRPEDLQAGDGKREWKGPMPSSFYHLYCPVTKQVVCRDPPAAAAAAIIGICELVHAERPMLYRRDSNLQT